MRKTRTIIILLTILAVIYAKVDSYPTSTRIIIPKKYAKRKVKVLILRGVKINET